ncbi:hypothetical protein RJ53_09245 [Methanocalculus chunghsingensis]|uniref:Response regulatory domain-containing protein n=1 Tax=Methanocalculus chunghsingensis TaxID=156457 RepID=A0A8J7W753_9EURY|nr:response regulator [Methanocalculus chunghsingensis]MBR1369649.1 hypothetical protein [Methanocalculus chunghsingensis]
MKHILIVEDSTTQTEYLRRIIEGDGYRVTTAADGESALGLIRDDPPDLVLSDIVMPGMDGYELCRRIKEMNTIPVFLVTQLFDPEDVIRGVACGADNFIIKPFDPAFILGRVREVFERGKEEEGDELSIIISDREYSITAAKKTILDILLSTYAIAVRKNADLEEARDELYGLNEQLQEKNEDLRAEIVQRERAEGALAEAHRKLTLLTSITRHGLLTQLSSIHESLEYAERVLDREPEAARDHLRTATGGIDRAIQTTRFTQEYQKIGESQPEWLRFTEILPEDTAGVAVDARVPGDLFLYLDPVGEKAVWAIITDAARRRAGKVTITYSGERDTGVITIEDDGIGIPLAGKDALFSYELGIGKAFSLFLAREALAITGIGLVETGDPRQGGRFEIRCPTGSIQHRSG